MRSYGEIFCESTLTNYFYHDRRFIIITKLLTPNEDNLFLGYSVLTLALKERLCRLRVVGNRFQVEKDVVGVVSTGICRNCWKYAFSVNVFDDYLNQNLEFSCSVCIY